MNLKLIYLLIILFPFNIYSQTITENIFKAYSSKDSSDFYFKKAKKLIKTNLDQAEYYGSKNAKCFEIGKQDSSIYYGIKALKQLKNTTNYNSIATIFNTIASVYNDKGEYDNAIKFRLLGLKFAEKQKLSHWIGTFCIGLSYDYHDFENYSKGVFYGKKAIENFVNKKNSKAKDIRSSFNATAINYDDWNKPELALFYHKQNLKHITGKDTLLLHSTFNNIGNTLLKQKKFEEANKWVLRALKIIDQKSKVNDLEYLDYNYATCYTNLATIATELNQIEEAKKYFDLAFKYSKKSKTAEKIRDYYFQKALFNKKFNLLEETIKEQENYIQFRDSIYTFERNKIIAELETKYQTEKKEKQILLQQSQVKQKNLWLFIISGTLVIGLVLFRNFKIQSKLQKEQLKLENKLLEEQSNYKIQEQRLEISRELHDNVGSQLTFIISILDNLKNSPAKFEETIDKKIDTLSNFASKSIVELRDTIWVLNSKKLNLSELKSRLLNFIKDAKDSVEDTHFHFEFEISNDSLLSSKQAINSFRVIQEIINNAIKHAQAKAIFVTLKHHQNQLEIIISDNGKGFDYEAKKKKSFGLTNIQNRIQELNGNLNVQSIAENGTSYTINIPL